MSKKLPLSRSGVQYVPEPKKTRTSSTKKKSEAGAEMSIPSIQSFSSCYMELCKRHKLRPLSEICITLPHYVEFTTDRLKLDDWGPILNSLSLDRTLKVIGIRSRYQHRKLLEDVDSEAKAKAIKKMPVILTRYLVEWLSQSVAQCVRNSTALTSLELEGIPMPPDCVAVLCVGLSRTQTLKCLSLSKCYIGDASCELICRTVADVPSIKILNLSHCDLTYRCGPGLSAALSRQKLYLFHDTWQQSLRYREPNLEAMPGLRRLTLNGNLRLGDSAVSEIIEVVTDSLWLKALDLQQCGLTDVIATEILDLIEHNKTLVVVDVRLNSDLREELALDIVQKIEANQQGSRRSEYKWLSLPKKEQNKATKRNDRQDDPLMIQANNKKSKNQRPLEVPKTAPCKRTPIEKGKPKQPASKPVEVPKPKTSPAVSKKPLHLDLKSVMEPCDSFFNLPEFLESRKVEKVVEVNEDNDEDTEMKIVEIVDQDKQSPTNQDLDDLFRQLADARVNHQHLLEETKRNDHLISDERARTETAEAKLESMKNDLSKLENALKERERETRGFLLASENSLEDISNSFNTLIEMLDTERRNSSFRSETEEEIIIKAEIRTKMTLLIRKTKSESFRRGYVIGEVTKDVKKFVKSEADITNNVPPINLSHLERHIGDSPDRISPSFADSYPKREDMFRNEDMFHDTEDYQKMGDTKMSVVRSAATQRARVIFSQILTGNMLMNIK